MKSKQKMNQRTFVWLNFDLNSQDLQVELCFDLFVSI